MKKFISLFLICGFVFALAACTMNHPKTSPKMLAPGEYTDTEKSTNAQGTTTEQTTNTNVYYDQYGNKRAVQETQTSSDPKGLFNKSTTSTTKTYD